VDDGALPFNQSIEFISLSILRLRSIVERKGDDGARDEEERREGDEARE